MKRACALLVGAVVVGAIAAGCALLNQAPIARIFASVVSGTSPLTVFLNAVGPEDTVGSYDPDGEIVSYDWDFGDGETDTGAVVSHTFVALGETRTFKITLTVTDDGDKTGRAEQTIEVRVGGGGEASEDGAFPVARLSVDRLIGLTPLTVAFDAGDSTAGSGEVVECDWDFGDGSKGIGTEVEHTFKPLETETYTVTLFVWNSGGRADTEQVEIIVIVPDAQTGDENPVAKVAVSETTQIYESDQPGSVPSLFEVTLDPGGTYADAGHGLDYYAWEFGDGKFLVETTDVDVTHVYELRTAVHTYVARLTVYDDQGLEGTVSVNVTLTQEAGG
jgi:PKD repeat protein